MSETIQFLRFLLGLRDARTSLTSAELDLIGSVAAGRRTIVEVGVYEGATSRILCRSMHPEGVLSLVDPYEPALKIERLLGFSCSRLVARRTIRPWARRTRFVQRTSLAAAELPFGAPIDLVFIDADHSYDAVRNDFLAWSPKLASDGLIALHDSRVCDARPDLGPSAGPVRLSSEIAAGQFEGWRLVDTVDSLSVIGRPPAPHAPPSASP